MRTVSEEEALEIADVIHELGKKMYSKEGAKFLEEAKKFLNEEPCWVEEENVGIFGVKGICIIGGLHGMGVSARTHHGEVFMIDAQMDIESFGAVRERNFFDELADIIKSTRAEFGCGLNFPFGLLERAPDPFPFVFEGLSEDFRREDFQSILRDENEYSKAKDYYRNYQFAAQRKHEHYFRSKSHSLRTCNARVFRSRWLARGNIA